MLQAAMSRIRPEALVEQAVPQRVLAAVADQAAVEVMAALAATVR